MGLTGICLSRHFFHFIITIKASSTRKNLRTVFHYHINCIWCGIWWQFRGYSILYLEKNREILSYIIFVRVNSKVINDCEKNDYYTVFLWTYPEHRGKGIATLMSKVMLQDLELNYNHFYKTISKNNISSIRVAEKCGFKLVSDCVKTGWLHTIQRVPDGTQYLYTYSTK